MNPDALYITSDYNLFVRSYIEANLTKDLDAINFCLKSLQCNFKLLTELFNKKSFKANILLATLTSLLAKDDKPKASLTWKLNKYNEYLFNNGLTFYDHLQEAFLHHIYHVKTVYKNYPKSYKLFYYISNEIKMFLFKIIRKICQICKRDYYTNSSYISLPAYTKDLYIDTKLISIIEKQNPLLFSFYMLSISTNFNSKKIKYALKLNNPQYKKLKEELCQLIKQLLLNN